MLYPNEADTRKIFMWFQDKLPKPDERPNLAGDDRTSSVNRAIDAEFAFLLSEKNVWLPSFFSPSAAREQRYYGVKHATAETIYSPASAVYFRGFQRKTAELEKYFDSFQPAFSAQTAAHALPASVFEYNLASYSEQQERDAEWNSKGLESGLNPMVRSLRAAVSCFVLTKCLL